MQCFLIPGNSAEGPRCPASIEPRSTFFAAAAAAHATIAALLCHGYKLLLRHLLQQQQEQSLRSLRVRADKRQEARSKDAAWGSLHKGRCLLRSNIWTNTHCPAGSVVFSQLQRHSTRLEVKAAPSESLVLFCGLSRSPASTTATSNWRETRNQQRTTHLTHLQHIQQQQQLQPQQ